MSAKTSEPPRAAPGGPPALRPSVHHAEEVMGTVVTLDVYRPGRFVDRPLVVALAAARAELHRADALFSTYRPNSPISLMRRGELDLAEAPGEVAEVLAACAELREKTKGWFDPWAMPGGIDPSGYVKGWAAQRALAKLAVIGPTGAIVNAAGDVAACGAPQAGSLWRIGIADPLRRGGLGAIAEITAAVATSGTAERGAHLLDPRSGRAESRVASATVCGADPGVADALATALAVGGEAALEILDAYPGYEALLIGFDRRLTATAAFPFAPESPRPS